MTPTSCSHTSCQNPANIAAVGAWTAMISWSKSGKDILNVSVKLLFFTWIVKLPWRRWCILREDFLRKSSSKQCWSRTEQCPYICSFSGSAWILQLTLSPEIWCDSQCSPAYRIRLHDLPATNIKSNPAASLLSIDKTFLEKTRQH